MAYHDWQSPFLSYFGNDITSLSIVELGKGEGTLFLHKHFKSVVSVEYSRYPFVSSWENIGLPNHSLESLTTPTNINALDDVLIHTHGSVRPKELEFEAKRLHDAALKHSADILFINHGCHNRGEVLELAKEGPWKYIAIHDTNFPYYGYKISSDNHQITQYTQGQGTIFFKKYLGKLVTVVIPTIGRTSISRSLNSLVSQYSDNWLALVGHDGLSLENSTDLMKQLPTDERIKHIRFASKIGGGANHGGEVRNKLIGLSETKWVCFLDDDDSFRPTYVTSLENEISKHPDADVVIFRMSYDKEDTRVLPPRGSNVIEYASIGISFAVKRGFLQRNNLKFRNSSSEDFQLLSDMKSAGAKIVFSEIVTYNVRF
jgi:hypothetical protein